MDPKTRARYEALKRARSEADDLARMLEDLFLTAKHTSKRCGAMMSSIRFGDPMQDAAEADALCAEMAKAADRFMAADMTPENLAQLCCAMLEKAGKRSESKSDG